MCSSAASPGGHDELLELLRRLQPAAQPDRLLVEAPFEAAHRGGEVLRLDGLDHLGHSDSSRLEIGRPDLDRDLPRDAAHHRDLGHAGDAAQAAGDPGVGQQRQLGRGELVRRQDQGDDRHVARIELAQDRLLELDRQVIADAGDGVPHVLGGLVGVLGKDELDRDLGETVAR